MPARRSPARCTSRPTLPAATGNALAPSASHAFVNGIHLAVVVGAALALISAVIVYRKLPHSLTQSGALHGAAEALEEVAAMGLGGVPPVFADEQRERGTSARARPPARHHEIDRERSALTPPSRGATRWRAIHRVGFRPGGPAPLCFADGSSSQADPCGRGAAQAPHRNSKPRPPASGPGSAPAKTSIPARAAPPGAARAEPPAGRQTAGQLGTEHQVKR